MIGLIEAGEAGGILSEVLERLASLVESQSKIKGQITGALIYPIAILVLSVTISLALLIFIVPTFDEMFKGMGAELCFNIIHVDIIKNCHLFRICCISSNFIIYRFLYFQYNLLKSIWEKIN